MTLVIDASVALTWCFDDEQNPATDEIGRRVAVETAIVPNLFHLELVNILLVGERKGRVTANGIAERLDRINRMAIEVDDYTAVRAWDEILELARAEGLTSHDAAYLELAVRLGAELATLDTDLIAAARRRGVTVLP